MQFKKAQHEMIEKIIESSDDIIQVAEIQVDKKRTLSTYKKIFEFSSNPSILLIFEKRGNHRYWYLEDRQ